MSTETTGEFIKRLRKRGLDFDELHGCAEVCMAAEFAAFFHRHQIRKYDGSPYFSHCAEVASYVSAALQPVFPARSAVVAAAYLHDVVEDCPEVSIELVGELFGGAVAELVAWVTKATKPGDGSGGERAAIERERLAQAPPDAKTIKIADVLSNTRDLALFEPESAKIYLREKELLLPLLKEGNPVLWHKCCRQLQDAWNLPGLA